MSTIIELQSVTDERGTLTVLEKMLPFDIKRIFYIHGVQKDAVRGGHGHKKAQMALVSVCGACKVRVNDGKKSYTVDLSEPDKVLYLEPYEWHEMFDFAEGTVLLTLSSDYYDKNDYFYEEPDIGKSI